MQVNNKYYKKGIIDKMPTIKDGKISGGEFSNCNSGITLQVDGLHLLAGYTETELREMIDLYEKEDKTDFVQYCFDNKIHIPKGTYKLSRPITFKFE